jgi:sugar/nucleoside kinase (ribokinase family)
MISFGSVFLELVFGHVRTLPGPGEEIFTDEFAMSCGGAVTSAAAAARTGVRAGLCSVLGDDLGSRVVQEFCARRGVDTGPSLRVRRPSAGITIVLNFDGDRAFVTHQPPRPPGEPGDLDRWRRVLRQDQPRWCYLHSREGVPDLMREARAQGTRTVLDINLGDERRRDLVLECIGLADVFVPNEAELLRLTGTGSISAAADAAAAWGTQVVVTRGAAGALVVTPDGVATEVRDGGRPVEVRDLTGAGDNFAGAMIGALVQGATLVDAVVAGNAAGSEAVSQLGAVGEVEVAGFSSTGRTLGAGFVENVAAAALKGTVAGLGERRSAGDEPTADEPAADEPAAGDGAAADEAAAGDGAANGYRTADGDER